VTVRIPIAAALDAEAPPDTTAFDAPPPDADPSASVNGVSSLSPSSPEADAAELPSAPAPAVTDS